MKYKSLTILLLFFLNSWISNGQEENKKLSFSFKNATLKEIIKEIEKQTDYSFVYNQQVDLQTRKTITINKQTLIQALPLIFENTNIRWEISGKHILLKKSVKEITVSGYVTDHKSGETLIGASLLNQSKNEGFITNNYGYFTFQVPEGNTDLEISYVGYKPEKISFYLLKDTLIHVKLEETTLLKEIVVYGNRNRPFSPSSGSIEFTDKDIKNTPSPFGEADVMRTLQLLPGIQSGIEGTTGLYVRGGGPDQNLTLLDGVSVYNSNHFFGLFSIFNGDAVKKVTLYKGSFPARFGGRLSSVIDIRLKDGDMQHFHGSFSLGLLSSRLNLEGPIIKDKTSFNISVRRSYIDAFLRIANWISDDVTPIIYFYDLNAKINHKFSDRSRLYFSLYNGKDKIGVEMDDPSYSTNSTYLEKINYQWGNTIGSLRWNYILNNQLFINTTAAYTRYKFDFLATNGSWQMREDESIYNFQYTNFQYSGIEDWSASVDLEYIPDNKHHIRFGSGYIFHTFEPEVHGSRQFEQDNGEIIKNINHSFLNENITGHEVSLYLEDEYSLTNKWKANLGMHLSGFIASKKSYLSLQPRVSLGYEHNRNLSFKTSYTEMSQYIHLLMSSVLSQPTDLWVPVTPELEPMRARQVTLGAFYDTRNGYNFSLEGFYKQMSHLLEYRDGASWGTASTAWHKQVESGTGRAYGLELFAQKTTGRLTGWIGYTLAWSDKKFPTINEGKRFPDKYDRRHDVKLNLTYKPSEKIDFSAAWTCATGNNFTLALEEYPTLPLHNLDPSYYYNNSPMWLQRYEKRNNYRIKPTHHLDLSMNYYRKMSPKGRQASWNLTVYNVYNQACPYMVYPWFDSDKGNYVLKQISLLPISPSITYTYKF